MTEPEKIAKMMKRVLIEENQIDRTSDLLTEISNKHFTVWSGDYRFVFSPLEGEVKDCLQVAKGSRIWNAQDELTRTTPIDYLTRDEVKKLGQNIRKAGLKCKIEAKRYYVVTINGCRVNAHFNHGPTPDKTGTLISFPESMHNNLFEVAETADTEKAKLIRYHTAYLAFRHSKKW